jgi:hypothetical protein
VGPERQFGASEISWIRGMKKVLGHAFQDFNDREFSQQLPLSSRVAIVKTDKMATEDSTANGTRPGERHAIGIAFGNSNSSIAYTTIEDKAEVIANEDGGM